MYVDPATVTLVFRLGIAVVVGFTAMMAFVVLTVDRLNARVAELESIRVGRDLYAPTGVSNRAGRSRTPSSPKPSSTAPAPAGARQPDARGRLVRAAG